MNSLASASAGTVCTYKGFATLFGAGGFTFDVAITVGSGKSPASIEVRMAFVYAEDCPVPSGCTQTSTEFPLGFSEGLIRANNGTSVGHA